MGYYPQVPGPTIAVGLRRCSTNLSDGPTATVDSTDVAAPRIADFAQRTDYNIGDLSGTIYNSTGGGITLVGVSYSTVGESGPFSAATILVSDPLYNFPAGTPAGQAFNIPIEITEDITGNIWVYIEISYA